MEVGQEAAEVLTLHAYFLFSIKAKKIGPKNKNFHLFTKISTILFEKWTRAKNYEAQKTEPWKHYEKLPQ